MRTKIIYGAVSVIAFAVTSGAFAQTAEWSVQGAYTEIVATDCRDCEEDIGILIACTGNGQAAEITVNAAAAQTGTDGAFAPVTFDIDGQRLTYAAKTVEFGMIGFTPVFQIAYDDPLTEALQGGRQAKVIFNGEQSLLGLKGSRSALDIFKSHCGWTPQGYQQNLERAGTQGAVQNQQQVQQQQLPVFNQGQQPAQQQQLPVFNENQKPAQQQQAHVPDHDQAPQQTELPPYSQTVLSRNPPTPDADGLFWYTGDGFGGGSPKALRYALPETDAAVLYASCERRDEDGVLLEIYSAFGDLEASAPVAIEITHAKGNSRFMGSVFIEGEEYAGSRFVITNSDPIWQTIAASEQISIVVHDQPKFDLAVAGASAPLKEFASLCGT